MEDGSLLHRSLAVSVTARVRLPRTHTLNTQMHTRDRRRNAKGISPRVTVTVAHCIPVGLSGTDSAKMSYIAGRRKHDIKMTPS